MATDFAMLLQRFLTSHLAGLRGASSNTVTSYRDTFKLLIIYLRDQKAIPPEKLTLNRIDVEIITGFLNWLESHRQNSVSTRNKRLAAISSFYTWMQSQEPRSDGEVPGYHGNPCKKADTNRCAPFNC